MNQTRIGMNYLVELMLSSGMYIVWVDDDSWSQYNRNKKKLKYKKNEALSVTRSTCDSICHHASCVSTTRGIITMLLRLLLLVPSPSVVGIEPRTRQACRLRFIFNSMLHAIRVFILIVGILSDTFRKMRRNHRTSRQTSSLCDWLVTHLHEELWFILPGAYGDEKDYTVGCISWTLQFGDIPR